MTIGIVGYGSFGKLTHILLQRFAPEVKVRVFSSRSPADGKTFFSLEDTAASDALIFCVPIRNMEETLLRVLPHLRPDTTLVDVATVKTYTEELFTRIAPAQPYLATHPMFGPESYKKKHEDVTGFRVVITQRRIPADTYSRLVDGLRKAGFEVVETTAADHDRRLAETLFLTHFVSQVISRAGFTRTDIDTVSFGYLMDAVESVRYNTELFKDVFTFNPFCEEVLGRFEGAEKEVHGLLKKP